MKKIVKYIGNGVGIALIAGILAGATYLSTTRWGDIITQYLQGQNLNFGKGFQESSAQSRDLNKQIVAEGSVLLKNDTSSGGGLPLSKETTKVNLFGWASTENGFIYSGVGSGLANLSNKISLKKAFNEKNIEVNDSLLNKYQQFCNQEFGNGVGTSDRVKIIEPDKSFYTQDLIDEAKSFSDTAIVTISRHAGENIGEVPLNQPHYKGSTDNSRTMLQLSREEEDMLSIVEENFDNVIVLLNTGNAMETSFLNNKGIDAALNCGIVGVNGTEGIVSVLTGESTPSGRTVDTFVTSYKDYDPTYHIFDKENNNVQYLEDIYFGYKYYETRYLDDEANYRKAVQYPFGYGLSYTTFSWELTDVSLPEGSDLVKEGTASEGETDNSKVTLTFAVTNTGKVAGKDVLELYYTAPYTEGEIEKSAINLVDFAKTAELKPGQTQTGITMSFSTYDLASYDAYDKNQNGKKTWELDPGEYQIKVMTNAHTPAKLVGRDSNILTYNVPQNPDNPKIGYYYLRDPQTNKRIQNRFTDTKAISGVPIDGSTAGMNTNYMSRANFEGTFPQGMEQPTNGSEVSKADNYISNYYDQDTMPTLNANNGLYLFTDKSGAKASKQQLEEKTNIAGNDELIKELLEDWNSPKWDQLLDQLDFKEMNDLIAYGGWGTQALESVGKLKYIDNDGPQGFNLGVTSTQKTPFTGFASETTLGQTWSKSLAKDMGASLGLEGNQAGVNGWYGPAVNLHRSQFNFRNYEYYSEDPVLSGKMGANAIIGAKSNGVYAYLKHFALSELGQNSFSVNVWLTEQNLRENYLKAFEIAVKEGESNAIMTAFNGIGAVYAGRNYALNVSILRNEWGFKGSLITDWAGTAEMNDCKNFVRGGNDLRLGNASNGASGFDQNNPTDVYCMKQSTKNIIYTGIDTYYFAKNYDHEAEGNKVNIGEGYQSNVGSLPWWKGVLYGVDGVAALGLVIWVYFVYFHDPKKIKAKKLAKEKKNDITSSLK